jgi:hypothetical protein
MVKFILKNIKLNYELEKKQSIKSESPNHQAQTL